MSGPAGKKKKNSAQQTVDRAAICVIQKQEQHYLQEWINYHFAYGFHDIYIFHDSNDDDSSNNKTSTQEPMIKPTKHVHVLPLGKDIPQETNKQFFAYNACVQIIKKREKYDGYKTTFVAHFDVDEFLVLKQHSSVVDFMKQHCPENLCGSIGIPWLWFGTSNHTYYSPNQPLTQRFVYRDIHPDRVVKSITRVKDFVCTTNPHFPHLTNGFNATMLEAGELSPPFPYDTHGNINLKAVASTPPFGDVAVFHHYTKSLEEWYARHCIRGEVHRVNNTFKCNGRYPSSGEVYDSSAGKFYQTHVLDNLLTESEQIKQMKKKKRKPYRFVPPIEDLPAWQHYNKSHFEIQEICTPRKIFSNIKEPKNGTTGHRES